MKEETFRPTFTEQTSVVQRKAGAGAARTQLACKDGPGLGHGFDSRRRRTIILTEKYEKKLQTIALVWLDWFGGIKSPGEKTKRGRKEGRGRKQDLISVADVWPK